VKDTTSRRPARDRRASVMAALALAVLLPGCAHGRRAEPPSPGPAAPCAGASFVPAGQPRPARVEVENRTEQDVRILLDRCRWWTRLGSVEAGRTVYLRLPDRLLRFGEGLRFHAFTETPNRWYGAYAGDFGVPMAHLVVSADNALQAATAPDTLAGDGGETRAVVSRALAGAPAVSAFSFDSYAVLTWRCTAEGVELTFSSGARLAGDPSVTLSLGSRELRFGTWSLIRAYTDGAAAPAEVVAGFTAAIRRAKAVTLLVGVDPDVPERYSFNTRELDEALRGLDCLR
jgi:hypothetical protein